MLTTCVSIIKGLEHGRSLKRTAAPKEAGISSAYCLCQHRNESREVMNSKYHPSVITKELWGV